MLISPTDGVALRQAGRIQSVLQNEAAECGLACLAMIATAFGHRVTLAELRRRFSVSSKGMGLRAVLGVADALGFSARPVRLELGDLRNLKCPAVLHWDLGHFVVLERMRGDHAVVHDPAVGLRRVGPGELDRSFTGVAVEFTPSSTFVAKKHVQRVGFADVFRNSRGILPSILQLLILASVMQLFALLMPILNQLVVDEAVTKGDFDLVTVLAGAMLLLLATTTVTRTLQGFVGLYLGTQMAFQMKTNLLRHTLRLPVSWFEKRHVGDVLSRFSSLAPIQDMLVNSISTTILSAVTGILALIMMIIYSPLLAGLQFLSVAILFGVRLATFPYVRRLAQEGLQLDAQVQTTFLETIRSARTFKLFGHEQERVSLWQNEQATLINNQVSSARFALWGGAGSALLIGIQQIVVWTIGARLVIDGAMTLGMLFAFQAYTAQFGSSASALLQQVVGFRTARIHLDRLSDVVLTEEERGLDVAADRRVEMRGKISLRQVGFRYADHEPDVLDEVDLVIRPGEFVLFSGPSGQGKTTLLKLMLGFEEPQRGTVLVDDVPLRQFGVGRFRSQIGAVLQDDALLAGTIADNISFFDIDGNQEMIEEAAKAANIHDEVLRLPMGYQTFAGDLGSSLSGGQRQRVLLARALYRNPKVLFLDEGTANLDPAAEEAVMDTIRGLEITRIVVAHRPGGAAGASRMIEVVGGKLVEARRSLEVLT